MPGRQALDWRNQLPEAKGRETQNPIQREEAFPVKNATEIAPITKDQVDELAHTLGERITEDLSDTFGEELADRRQEFTSKVEEDVQGVLYPVYGWERNPAAE